MGNPWRGEVTLGINGRVHVMKLTLGALAELEASAFSSRDVIAVLEAGLRGGGDDMDAGALAQADIDGGPLAAARAAAELLARAFLPAPEA